MYFRLTGWAIEGNVPDEPKLVIIAYSHTSNWDLLVLAPEGTRTAGSVWKSGFWRIADAADVPVLMGFVDRHTKRMGFGPALKIDGDAEGWMEQARAFYEDKRGLKPENRGHSSSASDPDQPVPAQPQHRTNRLIRGVSASISSASEPGRGCSPPCP
jgi:hypothetical protein